MSEFTIGQLMKIILGIFVILAVVIGVSLIFKNKFLDFFKGLSAGDPSKLVIGLLK